MLVIMSRCMNFTVSSFQVICKFVMVSNNKKVVNLLSKYMWGFESVKTEKSNLSSTNFLTPFLTIQKFPTMSLHQEALKQWHPRPAAQLTLQAQGIYHSHTVVESPTLPWISLSCFKATPSILYQSVMLLLLSNKISKHSWPRMPLRKLSSRNRVSPFRTEFSMGSLLQQYQQSLRACGVTANFCGVIADPCSVILSPIPEVIGGRAVFDAAMPIVAWVTKDKTLLNIVKYYETLVKHCDTDAS